MVDPRMMRVWVGGERRGGGVGALGAQSHIELSVRISLSVQQRKFGSIVFFYTLKVTLLM